MTVLGSLSVWLVGAALPGVLTILLQIIGFGSVGLTFGTLFTTIGLAGIIAGGVAFFVFAL
jgi:hypothetical protein